MTEGGKCGVGKGREFGWREGSDTNIKTIFNFSEKILGFWNFKVLKVSQGLMVDFYEFFHMCYSNNKLLYF